MTNIRVTVKLPDRSAERPSTRPLTHHEIIGLVGPFTRRGRKLDMAASRRAERELRFKPIDHPATSDGPPTLREDLALTVSEGGGFHLVRRLTALIDNDKSMLATLTAAGPDAAVLLAEIEQFPITRHFTGYDGVWLQRSYQLEPATKRGDETGRPWQTRLTEASAEIAGVRLDVKADIRRLPAEVRLSAPSGQRLLIPRDLLAVLGWHWRSVDAYTSHWRSSMRVAKREPQRTADIEQKLARTVTHLAETLSQPPARFHKHNISARWRAAFQRGIPLFAALGLIGGALAMTQVPIHNEAVTKLLAFQLPPLLLLLFFFGFDALPSFEIPRIPRALKQDSWLVSGR
jgi:hypothetical protein